MLPPQKSTYQEFIKINKNYLPISFWSQFHSPHVSVPVELYNAQHPIFIDVGLHLSILLCLIKDSIFRQSDSIENTPNVDVGDYSWRTNLHWFLWNGEVSMNTQKLIRLGQELQEIMPFNNGIQTNEQYNQALNRLTYLSVMPRETTCL